MGLIEDVQDLVDDKGTQYNHFALCMPYIHFQFEIPDTYLFENVVQTVINPKKRRKWDKDIKNISHLYKVGVG